VPRQSASSAPAIHETRAEIIQHRYLDDITGVFSRRTCLGLLGAAAQRARAVGQALLVAAVDIDRFGRTNDLYGMAVGDGVLRAVAQALICGVGPEATVVRMGNDEFLVIAEVPDPVAAGRRAADIVRMLAVPRTVQGHELHLTASVGFATPTDDGSSPELLIGRARSALATAKRRGGRTAVAYSPSMHGEERYLAGLEHDLARALNRGELIPHYQPQVDAAGGTLVGSEALVRWQHPGRGMVPPGSFLGAAASAGLLGELGAEVLRATCAQIAIWHAAGLAVPPVSVNIEPVQLLDPDFSALLVGTVADHGLSPADLKLELTERGILDDVDTAYRRAGVLRDAGFALALDDFGTGQSSLAMLHRFPFEAVKIDRSFIAAMETDSKADRIVRAICALGRELGMTVVAEGVEEPSQHARLVGYGCTHLQGWLFGAALAPDEFAGAWLAA